MENWRNTTLGEVLTFQRGFDITKSQQQDGPYFVISSSGPQSTHNEYKVNGPGIVIGRKGTLGSVFYSEKPFWPHDTTLWVKDFHGNDPKFAYYFLKTLHLEQYDAGASNPSLNRNHIHLLPVKYPPLPVQRKIADVLSAYDDLIEVNTRRIRILEQMAQSVYREWFGKVDANAKSLPEGWKIVKLGDACNIVMGQSPASEFYNEDGKGLPFHQGVTNFGDRYPTDKVFCTVENRIAEKDDILFSVRAPVGRLNISTKKIVIGRGLCAIRSKIGNQAFVFQQLKEQFHEDDMMGGGTIFKSVTKDDVLGIKFLLPTKDLIDKFEEFSKPIWRELELLTAKNANLRLTRDLLLPRLVSGEIAVHE